MQSVYSTAQDDWTYNLAVATIAEVYRTSYLQSNHPSQKCGVYGNKKSKQTVSS